MRFLYPLGLIGLIGIPILIIIYIIKNKYTEQTIPSTYLWELSEKFLKRKKRVNPLAGLISLILQIVLVTCFSLAVAHPIILLPNRAQELCFLIDTSGSMNMEKDGVSRLDRAKAYVEEQIGDSVDGSVYSVISVSSTMNVLCERMENREDALEALEAIAPGNAEMNESETMNFVQGYFNENPGIKVVFVTDQNYKAVDNLQLVNVAENEKNVAVSLVDAEIVDTTLSVLGTVENYGMATPFEVTLDLYVNGQVTSAQSMTVSVDGNEPVPFTFYQSGTTQFDSARVVMRGVFDDFAKDNESVLFSVESENAYDVLIVSETPYLIGSAIDAAGSARVLSIDPTEYQDQRGYGLYVFDGFAPAVVPTDGAVWFMNIKSSIPGTGFSFQAEETLSEGEKMSLSTSSATLAQKLLKDVSGRDIYISKYLRYGRSKHFVPLMTYKNTPILFTGVTDAGNREVVFAFDIHDTDFPLHTDFTVLVRNLLNYSFPAVLDKVDYFSGETLEINVVSGMSSIRVEAPSGKYVYLSTDALVAEYVLDEVGKHKITVSYSGEDLHRDYFVYASVPTAERDPYAEADYVGLQGEATDDGLDGKFDTMNIWFALIAICFLVDWAVYCYDKYQLR